MTKEKITQILNSHKEYLNGAGGCCADLIGADLHNSDLSGADLSKADLSKADLREANLSGADLSGADLSGADLSGADLSGADLLGADIDFSCLPLWCGSLSAKFDDKQIKQFMYHIVKAGLSSPNVSDRIKSELEKLIPLANDFHRAIECSIVETIDRDVKLKQYIQSLKQLLKL